MGNFKTIAGSDIKQGEAVIFDPFTNMVRAIQPDDVNKEIFQVKVSEKDHSYTLIQDGITLTEDQAEQIYTAFYNERYERTARKRVDAILNRGRLNAEIEKDKNSLEDQIFKNGGCCGFSTFPPSLRKENPL